MATWMVHLRVGDKLIDCFQSLEPSEFLVGNIAPDSGVPNEDWSVFTPDRETSHFKIDGKFNISKFKEKYMVDELWRSYDKKQKSFFLGYYSHLITDELWQDKIVNLIKGKYEEDFYTNKKKIVSKFKGDWEELDYLYFKRNPNFRGFIEYEKAIGFKNIFMDEFSEDAFDNRRVAITEFYREREVDLDREYNYMTEQEKEWLVSGIVEGVVNRLKEELWFK